MDADRAMDIGMKIAERHTAAVMNIFKAKPGATMKEALRGTEVWLGAEIMRALGEATEQRSR